MVLPREPLRTMEPQTVGLSTVEPPGMVTEAKAEEDLIAVGHPGKQGLHPCQAIAVYLSISLPNVLIVACFSDIGFGVTVYNAVSPRMMNYGGKGLLAFSCVIVAFYYIFSWETWKSWKRKCSLLIPAFGISGGTVLVGRSYAWAPLVMVMFLLPLLCGLLRTSICKHTRRKMFFRCVFICTLVWSIALAATWTTWWLSSHRWTSTTRFDMAKDTENLWKSFSQFEDPAIGFRKRDLSYVHDCGPDKNVTRFSSDMKTKIGMNCQSAITVLFTCWASPLIAAVGNLLLGVIALLSGVRMQKDKLEKLESLLKTFLGLLALVLMGMYFSVSMAGLSVQLGSTLMAFFASALCVLVVTMFMEIGSEIGPENMRDHVKNSKLSQMLLKAWHSDWARAIFIGAFNVCLPFFLMLNWCRQRQSHASTAVRRDRFTPLGMRMVGELQAWKWVSILQKICLLGELFFVFQVGVAKITYIFLSWLNEQLECDSLADYAFVIGLVFIIGYTMFLLPPVPGVPVYVFCGIVVAAQGMNLDDIGFELGCVIACILAWSLKLTACTGQYMIGYCMGKSVRVQALIGVDKVFTRAIEKILKVPGLSIGKVAVLVGGPDWPTSVTCGILKLSIPQMLLGTAPVFFVSSPCVLAGAFLARPESASGENSIWSALGKVFMGLMGIGQLSCGFLAVSTVSNVILADGDELAKPRAEHAEVEELSRQQAEAKKTYDDVTKWSSLASWRKFTLCSAAVTQLFSGFLFAMGGEYCFRSFSVSSKIGAPYEEDGLDGNAVNIVLPLGWCALGFFAVGTLLHVVFAKDIGRLTRRRLAAAAGTAAATTN